jgi:nucleoside 2-deoxyribosyltransferase
MGIVVKAPNDYRLIDQPRARVFLAGSIEMGKAELWQQKVAAALTDIDGLVIFDPRRDDWDSTWVQDPTPGSQFNTQVEWELKRIAESDLVLFYFDPATQSPITLLELGACLGSGKKVIVCCPDGYFRKGNVVITCRKFGFGVYNSIEELIANAWAAL